MSPYRALLLVFFLSRPAWTQTYTISTFAGGGVPVNIPAKSASFDWVGGVTPDSAGNIYFNSGQNAIMKLDVTSRMLSVVAGDGSFGSSGDNGPANLARVASTGGMAFDSKGDLYFSSFNQIRKISKGIITTIAGSDAAGFSGDNGPATDALLNRAHDIAVDASDNIYVADTYNHRIRKISKGIITTVAGNGSDTASGDNGPALAAGIGTPWSVLVDRSGTIYIADRSAVRRISNGVITTFVPHSQNFAPLDLALDSKGVLYICDALYRIRKFENGVLTTIAGVGFAGFAGDDWLAIGAYLNNLDSIGIDRWDNIYVADAHNLRLRRVTNGVITTVAGNGVWRGLAGVGGPAANAQLPSIIWGVARDAAGTVYFSTQTQVFAVNHGVLTLVAGKGTAGFSGDNGPATDAELNIPLGLAVDYSGNIYIGDAGNYRVRRVSAGIITTVAGNGTNGSSGDNGPATSAELTFPSNVAVDAAGNLYITGEHRIRKVSNQRITTVAGTGKAGFGGDNGPADKAQLNYPRGLAVDSTGNLYIADRMNSRIRRVSNQVISTVPGSLTDGSWYPDLITVDGGGTLYLTDPTNALVRKLSFGVMTTIAGGGDVACGLDRDDVPATSIPLCNPGGIAADPSGYVYFADGHSRIRFLAPQGANCSFSVSPNSWQATASGGNLTIAIQGATACPWKVIGLPEWITLSQTSSVPGGANLVLSMAANSGAARDTIISIAGNRIPVTQSALPSINAGGVLNAASFAKGAPVAAGSIATVYGSFPGVPQLIAASSQLPFALDEFTLHIGSAYAPLFSVSSGQANFQIPWELSSQPETSLAATIGKETSGLEPVKLARFAPGIFTMNAQGTGQGAILDSSYRLVDNANPAIGGSTVIQIYCTGLGEVTNVPATGSAAVGEPLSLTTTTPVVMIGGKAATVLFSGLAPGTVGEYQVNALVPAGVSSGPSVPVTIVIGNVQSNTATIAVK